MAPHLTPLKASLPIGILTGVCSLMWGMLCVFGLWAMSLTVQAQDAQPEAGWSCDPPAPMIVGMTPPSIGPALPKPTEAGPAAPGVAAYDYPVAQGPLGISPYVWGAVLGPAGVITVHRKANEHRATRRAVLGAITGAAIYGTLYFVIGSVSR